MYFYFNGSVERKQLLVCLLLPQLIQGTWTNLPYEIFTQVTICYDIYVYISSIYLLAVPRKAKETRVMCYFSEC